MKKRLAIFVFTVTCFFTQLIYAADWKNIKLETDWHIGYAIGKKGENNWNKFQVNRGYLTLKLMPSKWFETRITTDTYLIPSDDKNVGNIITKLKYLYGKIIIPIESIGISNPDVEIGMVHTPWFDFEEGINKYRVHGKMFIEQYNIISSADFGVTVSGLLGNKIKTGGKFPGKFGSFAFGVYNGGGYDTQEANKNKVFQSRISIRPLITLFPGLQVSHLLAIGKGNIDKDPTYLLNNVMGSLENKYINLTGQYTIGKGNNKGDKTTKDNKSKKFDGWSIFGELKPLSKIGLFGRYDNFTWNKNEISKHYVTGLSYSPIESCMGLISFDLIDITKDKENKRDLQTNLMLRIKY